MRFHCALLASLAVGVGCPGVADEAMLAPGEQTHPFAVALAGADLTVLEGSRVVLNGAASRGSEGEVRLVWTQLEGPAVTLTNASAPTPSFVAPLAPAELVFELEAQGGAVAVDSVRVTVASAREEPPGYIEVPPDTTAEPSQRVTFSVDTVEAGASPTLRARADCGVEPEVSGADVSLTLGPLPCAVIVDGEGEDGRGLAPAARVFWPAGTPLPTATRLTTSAVVAAPGANVALTFADLAPTDRAQLFGVDGAAVLPDPVLGEIVLATAPRRPGRVVFGGEVLRAGASGGVRFALLDVGAGSGNIAPVARGGADRIVQPGARFRIDASASFDADNDALTISSTQVIGAAATEEEPSGQVFFAPMTQGTLLFHVVADDGTVMSEPDPVRVVVDDAAENLRPVLTLAPERYVRPAQTFTIDASGAQDPDSGFIASYLIVQDEADAIRLLDEPLTTPSATLVAQSAGDTYLFHVSAFDEGGLGTTADVVVIVEEAGPYVDPLRGSDTTGNGTVQAPFASIVAALPTADRHAFDALWLAEGVHAAPPTTLPVGLDLVGGYRFLVDGYVRAEDAVTTVPIDAPTTVVASTLEGVRLDVAAAGAVLLGPGSRLLDAQVIATAEARADAPLVLPDASNARVDDTIIDAAASSGAAAVRVGASSVLALVASAITGGGDDAVALECAGGTVVISGSTLVGATTESERSTALRADSCSIVASGATLAGGTGASATGIDATSALISTDGATAVVGRTAPGGAGVGASIAGDAAPAVFEGVVSASELVGGAPIELDTASGLVLFGARVELLGAQVVASAPAALAIYAVGGVLSASSIVCDARGAAAVALALDGLGSATLHDGLLLASDTDAIGVRVDNALAELLLDGTSISAAAAGVLAPSADVTLLGAQLSVSGAASASTPVALAAGSARVEDASVVVGGVDAVALFLAAASSIERSTARVVGSGAACAAVRADGALDIISSFVEASGDGCVGIDQRTGALAIVHGTVIAAAAAVQWHEGFTAHNSVVAGIPAVTTTSSAPFDEAIGVAFSLTPPLATTSQGTLDDITALELAGCDLCMAFDLAPLVDATGHLAPGDNPLVDAADPVVSTELDIDGQTRPIGARPDIGCDER